MAQFQMPLLPIPSIQDGRNRPVEVITSDMQAASISEQLSIPTISSKTITSWSSYTILAEIPYTTKVNDDPDSIVIDFNFLNAIQGLNLPSDSMYTQSGRIEVIDENDQSVPLSTTFGFTQLTNNYTQVPAGFEMPDFNQRFISSRFVFNNPKKNTSYTIRLSADRTRTTASISATTTAASINLYASGIYK